MQEFYDNLALAKDFHTNTLGGATAGFHPQTIVVFSSGTTTMDAMCFNTDEVPVDLDRKWVTKTSFDGTIVSTSEMSKVAYTRRPTGDGTVPGVSGKCPESKATPIVAKDAPLHADVFKDSAFNAVVVSLVKKLLQCVVSVDDAAESSPDSVADNDSTEGQDDDSQDDGTGQDGDAVASNDDGGDASSGANGSDSSVASNDDGENSPSDSAA